jgi:hypothetical protein
LHNLGLALQWEGSHHHEAAVAVLERYSKMSLDDLDEAR